MKKNYEGSSKWILIICGLLTAVLGSVTVLPEIFLDKLFKLEYVQEYDIIVRHWSMMVLLVGVFLVISAFNKNWRVPVILFAMLEKFYLVIICTLALQYTYGKAFVPSIVLDSIMCILLVFVLMNEWRDFKRKSV